jgi:hypothetical protein
MVRLILLCPLALVLCICTSAAASSAARPPAPLRTAIVARDIPTAPAALDEWLNRAELTGASVIKLPVFWNTVSPKRPAAGASDPDNPDYRFATLDIQLQRIAAHGFTPLLLVSGAPGWARQAPDNDKTPLGFDLPAWTSFTKALASRYDGHHQLPKVKLWQAWNEPNGSRDLSPAFEHAKPVSPLLYRRIVETMADSVHGVSSQNTLVAGGLSPFGRPGSVISPLRFMRQLFCLDTASARPVDCRRPLPVDVWAVHPYTSGGPFHSAYHPNDVSLGDLPEVRALLTQAVEAGSLEKGRLPLWVTEFAWDSAPADPGGVPLERHARWTAAALYQMHLSGVELVAWFSLHDDPVRVSSYQSGLFNALWKPKPALRSFFFPLYVSASDGSLTIWGRTPHGKAGPVAVERRVGSRWQKVVVLRASSNGIFGSQLRAAGGTMRARAGAEISNSFSSAKVRDVPVRPFGSR